MTETTGERTPLRVLRTSTTEPDFRSGLWDRLWRAWPVPSFHALDQDRADASRASVLSLVQGLIGLPLPALSDRDALLVHRVGMLRETILQAALYYTAATVIDAELVIRSPIAEDDARGQWVQYSLFGLHAAMRSLPVVQPQSLDIGGMLVGGVIRRLAHEIPDASAIPDAIPGLAARLSADWNEADRVYKGLPLFPRKEGEEAASAVIGHAIAALLLREIPELVPRFGRLMAASANQFAMGIDAPRHWRHILDLPC